jgi:hypothetical protein
MSEIDSDWAHRGGIPQPQSHTAGVKRSKVVKSDRRKHIAAVIEDRESQALLNGQGNSSFGVDNQQLIAAGGNLNIGAVGRRTGTANLNLPLRPGSIQRKASLKGTRLFENG